MSENPAPSNKFSVEKSRQRAADALAEIRDRAATTLTAGKARLEKFKTFDADKLQSSGERFKDALQKEKESALFNLRVVELIAKNAAEKLLDKLKDVGLEEAFTTVWFGIHALIFFGAVAWKIETLIPDQGTLAGGINAYLENIRNLDDLAVASATFPIAGTIFTGLTAVSAKLTASEYDAKKQEKT